MANKVRRTAEVARIECFLEVSVGAIVPADGGVAAAERRGEALLDGTPGSPAVAAIEGLADLLERSTLQA